MQAQLRHTLTNSYVLRLSDTLPKDAAFCQCADVAVRLNTQRSPPSGPCLVLRLRQCMPARLCSCAFDSWNDTITVSEVSASASAQTSVPLFRRKLAYDRRTSRSGDGSFPSCRTRQS